MVSVTLQGKEKCSPPSEKPKLKREFVNVKEEYSRRDDAAAVVAVAHSNVDDKYPFLSYNNGLPIKKEYSSKIEESLRLSEKDYDDIEMGYTSEGEHWTIDIPTIKQECTNDSDEYKPLLVKLENSNEDYTNLNLKIKTECPSPKLNTECPTVDEECTVPNPMEQEIKIEYEPLETDYESRVLRDETAVCDSTGVNNEAGSNTKGTLLQCDVCPYETADAIYFSIHKKTHRFKHSCESCHYICGSPSKLLYHQKKRHMKLEDLLYYCGDCPFTTLMRKDLVKHRQEEHKRITVNASAKKMQCPKCTFKSVKKATLIRHQFVVHNDPTFRCSACKKIFLDEAEEKKHSLTHIYEKAKNGMYHCKLCDFSSKSKYVILEHDRKIHKMSEHRFKRLACDICSYATSKEWRFNRHMKCHANKTKND